MDDNFLDWGTERGRKSSRSQLSLKLPGCMNRPGNHPERTEDKIDLIWECTEGRCKDVGRRQPSARQAEKPGICSPFQPPEETNPADIMNLEFCSLNLKWSICVDWATHVVGLGYGNPRKRTPILELYGLYPMHKKEAGIRPGSRRKLFQENRPGQTRAVHGKSQCTSESWLDMGRGATHTIPVLKSCHSCGFNPNFIIRR